MFHFIITFFCWVFLFDVQASFPILTDDPACIPNVVGALGTSIKPEIVKKTQYYYKAFTSSPSAGLKDAHSVWRLMAALRATGDEKALELYQMLNSSYEQDNALPQEMGLLPDVLEINDAEKRVLNVRMGVGPLSYTDLYLASLVPSLANYWSKPSGETILKSKTLPMVLWPKVLVDGDVDGYYNKSRLRLVFGTPEDVKAFKDGCRKL